MSTFFIEGESRGMREKRSSRGRGRKGSDEDSPRKKKTKNRYHWVGGSEGSSFHQDRVSHSFKT